MRITERQLVECSRLEMKHLGTIRLLTVTRNRVKLLVNGESHEFIDEEGRFHSTSRLHYGKEMNRLAYLRAKEAVMAVRLGHKEAVIEKQRARVESNKKHYMQSKQLSMLI